MLHLPTLIVVLCLLFGVMTCVLAAMWRSRSHDPAVGLFALAFAAMLCGGGVAAFYRVLPTWSWAVVACSLFLLANGLIWMGLRRFDGLRTPVLALLACPVIYIIGVVPTGLMFEQGPRAALFSVLFSGLSFGCASQLVAGGRLEPLSSRKPLALAFAALGVVYAIRFFIAYYGAGSYQFLTIVFLVQLFNVFAFSMGLFALIKERAELALKTVAETDQLTGVPNRRSFFRLAQTPLRGAVVVIDLDHFKQINDGFGHAVGDEVLINCAKAVVPELRPGDVFARIGGEEFAVFLPEADETRALDFAERIRAVILSLSVSANGTTLNLTASAGVAVSGARPARLQDLLALADGALYRAKDLGRNQVRSGGQVLGDAGTPPLRARAA